MIFRLLFFLSVIALYNKAVFAAGPDDAKRPRLDLEEEEEEEDAVPPLIQILPASNPLAPPPAFNPFGPPSAFNPFPFNPFAPPSAFSPLRFAPPPVFNPLLFGPTPAFNPFPFIPFAPPSGTEQHRDEDEDVAQPGAAAANSAPPVLEQTIVTYELGSDLCEALRKYQYVRRHEKNARETLTESWQGKHLLLTPNREVRCNIDANSKRPLPSLYFLRRILGLLFPLSLNMFPNTTTQARQRNGYTIRGCGYAKAPASGHCNPAGTCVNPECYNLADEPQNLAVFVERLLEELNNLGLNQYPETQATVADFQGRYENLKTSNSNQGAAAAAFDYNHMDVAELKTLIDEMTAWVRSLKFDINICLEK